MKKVETLILAEYSSCSSCEVVTALDSLAQHVVLDRNANSLGEVTVVPMTGCLRRSRAVAARFGERSVTPALGASPRFRALIAERLWELCAQFGLDNTRTGAILVGEGAETMARELTLMAPVARVLPASQADQADPELNWVVLPLNASDGIPLFEEHLELGVERPTSVRRGKGQLVVDRPLLSDVRIARVVEDVLRYHRIKSRNMKKESAAANSSSVAGEMAIA